ncbi:hypothetical protein [Methylobacterium indicum]|uniref:Uncharacterized protein n=1 Tax=Methylobacterium indicum TaxID=1775910 RepID=A0A8H8WT27_9HYPH|nr:hypothetical protein [Methylobacterium indicum]BCM83727.1 hypothetical protein mvi_21880 [Methylobacterium indicum]
MTVTLAAWCLPLAASLILFAWALLTPASGTWDFAPVFRLAGAVVGSLVAWLVWALLR